MDPTISVSKGCFVFKNGATRANGIKRRGRKRKSTSGILDASVTSQPFYGVYRDTWNQLKSHIDELQQNNYSRAMNEVVAYVTRACSTRKSEIFGMDEILPSAALLTGINQCDHFEQFQALADEVQAQSPTSVCVLPSRDSSNLKGAVESMVYNFIEAQQDDEGHENNEDRAGKRLRRSQCTMRQLEQWYGNNFPCAPNDEQDTEAAKHCLVVILPDFESFNPQVLQDFILMLSSYCARIPFILILGIATSISAIHNTLPFHVTSKMKLRIFKTTTAPVCLNEILDKVVLSPKYSLRLSGKLLKFLTHIFLYYDFSINGFIQGYKYCVMEHFFQGNAYALCTNYSQSLTHIPAMTHEDIESIRRLLSFRPYVESMKNCNQIISILIDDDYLKKKLPRLLRDCHIHFLLFRIFIEFLKGLVDDLPKLPLGKYRRELFSLCLAKELIDQPEFKECWQIIGFMSKDEFIAKVTASVEATKMFVQTEIRPLELAEDCEQIAFNKLDTVLQLLKQLSSVGVAATNTPHRQPTTPEQFKHVASRQDLKEKLLQMHKQEKPKSEFAQALADVLDYIKTEIIECHLPPLSRAPPLHELFVFSDFATVRKNIIGSPRAALHMALNNPYFYLQCKCCALDEPSQLLPTLPDLSVAYKLHLECGRMINLYDWLQAFRSVVDDPDQAMQQEQLDPQIQARFTRAVAELQFLGYIKMSKRKPDHATRLTW